MPFEENIKVMLSHLFQLKKIYKNIDDREA